MKKRYRDGTTVEDDNSQNSFLEKLYGSLPGRLFVRLMIRPWVSKLGGAALSTKVSALIINPFIKKNGIDMRDYESTHYKSFNDFFSRKIIKEARPIDPDPYTMISPCDGRVTACKISETGRMVIKNSSYTVTSLLRNRELAMEYCGGTALLFRLTVSDYHRYCFVADGIRKGYTRIPGVFHTVNPVAYDYYPVYKENTREYTTLGTKCFGDIICMEVGATLVGRIENHTNITCAIKGQEKGCFRFGGSTIVLLFKEGVLIPDEDIIENSKEGIETVVRYGEKIGNAVTF